MCTHIHVYLAFHRPHHSLNLLSSINPNRRRLYPPALPRSTKAQEGSICKEERRRRRRGGGEERDLNREAGDGGQERRGFFGKGANPITGSSAAPVYLATLNSHFNGLFLPLPIPSPSIFAPLPDTFSPFCYRGRHSRELSKRESRRNLTSPNSLVQRWEEKT